MKALFRLVAGLVFIATSPVLAQDGASDWSIAIHGGAGTMSREAMTEERRAEYEAALQAALDAGAKVLADGGSAMDAVTTAILIMENDPKFNAGKGAVYTWDGENELDASIMDGRDRSAGAVTGVTSIKNPILLADKVRTHGRHVFLSGEGAEVFAREQGIETVDPSYFETEARRQSLERMKAQELSALDVDLKFGTVGAVARDSEGNLAAGTSTGGMTGKRWGRIGDAPVIGAGTYADNRSCAVSATGWGEYFIRVGVAKEICNRLREETRVKNIRIEQTLDTETHVAIGVALSADERQEVIDEVLAEVADLGGDGGVIVVTHNDPPIFSFNTAGMYRGRANSEGLNEVAIFADE